MRLDKITIRNYKSLRDVSFSPSPLSVLVGPNAAGKSNFADAIGFLSEVYSFGLETAIARKGGYENIALRRQRRSKAPIEFEVGITLETEETRRLLGGGLSRILKLPTKLVHSFSITTKGEGIKSPFKVKEESFCVLISVNPNNGKENFQEMLRLCRSSEGKIEKRIFDEALIKSLMSNRNEKTASRYIDYALREPAGRDFSSQDLFINQNNFGSNLSSLFSRAKIYQLSTTISRQPGVPTPNPILSSAGENLPALVDWLQRKHPKQWEIVASGMREVLPKLEEISVQYLHTKTLGLFFKEEGFGRSWSVEDVSDGTMNALAILVAAVDPRTELLVIEEPENSVHPWILRVILDRLREVSKSKNVILTSHSPTLVNRLKPEEVWIIYRDEGESRLRKLTEIDPHLEQGWENGEFQLAEFLDSGAIGQAVPGGIW